MLSNFNNIPESLRKLKHWVLWKNIYNSKGKGKPRKVPFQSNGRHAKTNDKKTWHSFDKIVEAYNSTLDFYNGIGFVFSEQDYCIGIDFDDCIINGVINKEVKFWIDFFDSYTEISVSGNGIHILVKGRLPYNIINQVTADGYNVEIYDKGRYFALSANIVDGKKELKSAVKQLNKFYNFYNLIDKTKKQPKKIKKIYEKENKERGYTRSYDQETINTFALSLPKRPYSRNNFNEKLQILSRLDALKRKYIQINSPFLTRYLVIESSNFDTELLRNKTIPEPTIVTVDQNHKTQLIYHLKYPINTKNQKSLSFYNDIKKGFINKLNGNLISDKDTLNPFFVHHNSIIKKSNTYTLIELNKYLSRKDKNVKRNKTIVNVEINKIKIGNRNISFFNIVRKQTYKFTARNQVTKNDIYEYCINELIKLNDQIRDKLAFEELQTIAHSISKYCYVNKDKFDSCKNRGAYSKHMTETMTLIEKQSISAKLTNKRQKENTKTKIIESIEKLKKLKLKITYIAISKISSICISNLRFYKEIIRKNKYDNMVCSGF